MHLNENFGTAFELRSVSFWIFRSFDAIEN